MDQVSIIRQMFKDLTEEQRQEFLNSINNKENKRVQGFESLRQLIISRKSTQLKDRPSCPHCNSENILKNGNVRGIQRFKCKECNKTFSYTTNTILYKSNKSIETWKKFCECMINKFSLRKSAEICNINLHTAFDWRHKILDALQNMQEEITLKGVVESDETFFALSFKGNKKGNFNIPREVHKRGHSVTTRGLSKEMVCVPCTVNHEGMSIGKISNLGKPNVNDLEEIINGRIEKGSVFVTDSLRSYSKIAYENELTHIRIPRGKYTNGTFNIQTINSYHSELKRLINHYFKGVATKYLNNYIVYHNFVNFAKNTFENKVNKLEEFVFSTRCLTRGYSISKRSAIPVRE